MKYYARLDEEDKPIILYRATPDMEEQVWVPDHGWLPGEFLQDCLEGWGSIYYIGEAKARKFFPLRLFNMTPCRSSEMRSPSPAAVPH